MLIRFSVENYRCFRDRVELSMIAGQATENRALHVVGPLGAPHFDLLKVGVLYGANASGKSNLVLALETAKNMILNPSPPQSLLPMEPFKLNPVMRQRPSRFEFEIKTANRLLAYGFVAGKGKIYEEWLADISGQRDELIFTRVDQQISFGRELSVGTTDQQSFLDFLGRSTLHNRLFLSECRARNVFGNVPSAHVLTELLTWFEFTLDIVLPISWYNSLHHQIANEEAFRRDLSLMLRAFDTGIESVALVEIGSDAIAALSDTEKAGLAARVDVEGSVLLPRSRTLIWLVDRHPRTQELRAQRLVFLHGAGDKNSDAIFELSEESDGTRRLMDLAPALMMLTRDNRVFVIDELNRSLHPAITHSFISNFLKYSQGRESQLIVTTHESSLLHEPLLRRDEIWLVQKGKDQSSKLIALEEFKRSPDQDRDLESDYLYGRFLGVPVVRDFYWMRKNNAT